MWRRHRCGGWRGRSGSSDALRNGAPRASSYGAGPPRAARAALMRAPVASRRKRRAACVSGGITVGCSREASARGRRHARASPRNQADTAARLSRADASRASGHTSDRELSLWRRTCRPSSRLPSSSLVSASSARPSLLALARHMAPSRISRPSPSPASHATPPLQRGGVLTLNSKKRPMGRITSILSVMLSAFASRCLRFESTGATAWGGGAPASMPPRQGFTPPCWPRGTR